MTKSLDEALVAFSTARTNLAGLEAQASVAYQRVEELQRRVREARTLTMKLRAEVIDLLGPYDDKPAPVPGSDS
jgi:hypothetical protein